MATPLTPMGIVIRITNPLLHYKIQYSFRILCICNQIVTMIGGKRRAIYRAGATTGEVHPFHPTKGKGNDYLLKASVYTRRIHPVV